MPHTSSLKGGGSAAIGQYLNETVVPAMALIEAGYYGRAGHAGRDQTTYRPGVGRGEALWRRRGRPRTRPQLLRPRPIHEPGPHAALGDRCRGWMATPASSCPAGTRRQLTLCRMPTWARSCTTSTRPGRPTALLCHAPVADRSRDAASARVPRRPDLPGMELAASACTPRAGSMPATG